MRRNCRIESGFSLIELLVVITIILILAALLLPVLSKAKAEAHSAACKNHLRQMGLALRMYVDDNNHTYPRSLCLDPGKVPVFWSNRLAPFYELAWTNTAYQCPGYRGAIVEGDGRKGPWGSYAYNAFGLRLTDSGNPNQPNPLGLGPMRGARVISDAQVSAPVEMYAIGESRFFSKEVNGAAGGVDTMVRGLLINTPPWLKFDPARHGKTYNQLFADGHVGAMNPWVLYNLDPAHLRNDFIKNGLKRGFRSKLSAAVDRFS